MPLKLQGSVTLNVHGQGQDSQQVEIDADDFCYAEGGMRLLGDECTRHEFLYRYGEDPRFELALTASVIEGVVESIELAINSKDDHKVKEAQNSIEAVFVHDPDRDDEPLTPVSGN